MRLRVALCQLRPVAGDIEANLEKIARAAEEARREEADVMLFPELALTGYVVKDLVYELAQTPESSAVSRLESIAAEHSAYLVVGAPELDTDTFMLYNSAFVVGPEGLLGVYRKRHLPSYGLFDEARYFKPYRGPIEVFETKFGKLGVAICYDVFFPETVRTMVLRGARAVLVLSAAPDMSRDHFETLVKARAMENTVYVAYVNMVGYFEGLGFFGGSHVRGPLGELLARLELHEEGVGVVELDYDYLARAREIRPILGDLNPADLEELRRAATPC